MTNLIASTIASIPYYAPIRAMYCDSRRDYHGLSHLAYQTNLISQIVPQLPIDLQPYAAKFLLNVSLFHDCYYEYTSTPAMSEQISAELAYTNIVKTDKTLAEDVRKAVLATSMYFSKEDQEKCVASSTHPKLALLFQDIDLHSMQNNKAEKSILREMLNFGITQEQINEGRAKFKKALLPRINHENGFYHLPFTQVEDLFNNNLVRETFA